MRLPNLCEKCDVFHVWWQRHDYLLHRDKSVPALTAEEIERYLKVAREMEK